MEGLKVASDVPSVLRTKKENQWALIGSRSFVFPKKAPLTPPSTYPPGPPRVRRSSNERGKTFDQAPMLSWFWNVQFVLVPMPTASVSPSKFIVRQVSTVQYFSRTYFPPFSHRSWKKPL